MAVKLLVVDDEEGITEILKHYFEMKGFTVCVAASGEEAIALLRQEKPEIILLDLFLNGKLDGVDVLKDAKINSPSSKVIMLTGSDSVAKEKEIKKIGVCRYLRKPVSVTILSNTIKEVLGDTAGGKS